MFCVCDIKGRVMVYSLLQENFKLPLKRLRIKGDDISAE